MRFLCSLDVIVVAAADAVQIIQKGRNEMHR